MKDDTLEAVAEAARNVFWVSKGDTTKLWNVPWKDEPDRGAWLAVAAAVLAMYQRENGVDDEAQQADSLIELIDKLRRSMPTNSPAPLKPQPAWDPPAVMMYGMPPTPGDKPEW